MRGMKICAMPDPMPIISVSEKRAAQSPGGIRQAEQIAPSPVRIRTKKCDPRSVDSIPREVRRKQLKADLLLKQLHLFR